MLRKESAFYEGKDEKGWIVFRVSSKPRAREALIQTITEMKNNPGHRAQILDVQAFPGIDDYIAVLGKLTPELEYEVSSLYGVFQVLGKTTGSLPELTKDMRGPEKDDAIGRIHRQWDNLMMVLNGKAPDNEQLSTAVQLNTQIKEQNWAFWQEAVIRLVPTVSEKKYMFWAERFIEKNTPQASFKNQDRIKEAIVHSMLINDVVIQDPNDLAFTLQMKVRTDFASQGSIDEANNSTAVFKADIHKTDDLDFGRLDLTFEDYLDVNVFNQRFEELGQYALTLANSLKLTQDELSFKVLGDEGDEEDGDDYGNNTIEDVEDEEDPTTSAYINYVLSDLRNKYGVDDDYDTKKYDDDFFDEMGGVVDSVDTTEFKDYREEEPLTEEEELEKDKVDKKRIEDAEFEKRQIETLNKPRFNEQSEETREVTLKDIIYGFRVSDDFQYLYGVFKFAENTKEDYWHIVFPLSQDYLTNRQPKAIEKLKEKQQTYQDKETKMIKDIWGIERKQTKTEKNLSVPKLPKTKLEPINDSYKFPVSELLSKGVDKDIELEALNAIQRKASTLLFLNDESIHQSHITRIPVEGGFKDGTKSVSIVSEIDLTPMKKYLLDYNQDPD